MEDRHPLETAETVLLLPDRYYSRRQRTHMLATPTGEVLYAGNDLTDLLETALAYGRNTLTLVDDDLSPVLHLHIGRPHT